MELTYYGHACFGVVAGGKRLLFDPFITPNPMAADINLESIECDEILISHAHADHLADAVALATRTGARVTANYEVTQWLSAQGIERTEPLNHGGRLRLDWGSIQYVNAIHSSSFPDGSYGGNPGGFIIESQDGCFYYSGDTALTWDMKIIAERSKLDFAVLCIGDRFTMGFEDACTAAQWVGCDEVVGVHYDTFPPIKIDCEQAQKYFASKGKRLHLPKIGTSLTLPGAGN